MKKTATRTYRVHAFWRGDGDDSWLIELLGKWTSTGDTVLTKTDRDDSREGARKMAQDLISCLLDGCEGIRVKPEDVRVEMTYHTDERAFERWEKRQNGKK